MVSSLRPPGPLYILLAILTLGSACTRQEAQASGDAGGHTHGEQSVQVTLWESGLELFIEYPVPEAGQAVGFITHVTYTASGAPRRTGPVKFTLLSATGEAHAHTEAAPARDGIYLPELSFPAGGTWRLTVSVPGGSEGGAPEATVEIELPPIEVAASHGDLHGISVPAAPEGIGFLKEQQWRFGTRIAAMELEPLTERLAVPAVVRAASERQADVTPPVDGRLEAPEGGVLPHIGDTIAAGDLLGYVRPPFSEYLARVQQAEAEIVRTRLASEREHRRLERIEALVAEQARSARELEEATFAVQLVDAEQAAAVAVAEALKTSGVESTPAGGVRFELRAPIAGFVREVSAVNGAFVSAGRPVFRIRDSSFVHLDALVRPESLSRISPSDHLLVLRARGSAGARELSLPEAELVFVGDELDPHTLTVPVLFEVPNTNQQLRIRERVEVHLEARAATPALALPVSAIVEEDGRSVVYVQLGGETFEKRDVLLGFHDGSRRQVLDGVVAGEHVVVEGGYAIRLASLAGGAPAHGHAH